MTERKPRTRRARKPKLETPIPPEPSALPDALVVSLTKLAGDYTLDSEALAKYAAEYTVKGNDQGNPYGTSFTVEGQFLYALARTVKPRRILEIGTYHGGGASLLAAACEANGGGEVVTVDIWNEAGQHIPEPLQRRVTVIHEDANTWILKDIGIFDFIFEDGNHSENQVHTIWQEHPRILAPGGWLITHDIATGMMHYILRGIEKGGVKRSEIRTYITPPSPCGIGIWHKPQSR